MKKIVILLMLSICAFCSAQTNHLKFKGIPMEGTLQQFTNQLKSKGFVSLGIRDGVSLLKGEFAGYKGCTIGAVADNNGMICKVSVVFPEMDKWADLENCYNNYKSMLTEKYGNPTGSVEEFQREGIVEESDKKYELSMDRCKYICSFAAENGEIELQITHQSFTCYVTLSYYDTANQEALRKQIMEDL